MNILFYFGHPAQYHFFKHSIKILRSHGHHTTIVIRSKDILENLLIENNEQYINILPEGRKQSKLQIFYGLIKRDFRLFRFTFNKKFDLFIGSDPSLAHIGRLLKIPAITVSEDDIEVIATLAKLTFPYTSTILTPTNVNVGKYSDKRISYAGYMKLAYLHPKYFSAKSIELKKPYFLLRLSQLNAHHDFGIKGLNEDLVDQIIDILSIKGNVYISSEKKIASKYDKHYLNIIPSQMHDYLANARMLISDSQSMSVEAAMLGIPSIRYSDFSGRITVLEELEHKYQLTFGVVTSEPEKLIHKINEILSTPAFNELFQQRRVKMLSEKIDVTAFLVWFIENYPSSVTTMKENSDYQFNFK
jgi:hypothetical protein